MKGQGFSRKVKLALLVILSSGLGGFGTRAATQEKGPATGGHGGFSDEVELVPNQLKARIYLHDIPSQSGVIACVSFVTVGLWSQKQKELILTFHRRPEDKPQDYPVPVLKFLKVVYEFAKTGRLVDVGDYTEFSPAGLFGDGRVRGIAYIRPQPLEGVEVPDPLLAGILLFDDEVEVAKSFGVTRVMANLGREYKYYPCPPWSERSRASVISGKAVTKQSVLAKIPRTATAGMSYRVEKESEIILSVLTDAADRLQAKLARIAPDSPIAFLTEPDPLADACLVWQPGQSELRAITPPASTGSSRTGNSITFAPRQKVNDFRYVEDGIALTLTDETWTTIRRALETGKPASVAVTKGGMRLSVVWVKK